MLIPRLNDREISGSCKVLAGDLLDPFTGEWIRFEHRSAREVNIDHLVALPDARHEGAAQWMLAQRVAFANDPLKLEAVDVGANRQKGDGDAVEFRFNV